MHLQSNGFSRFNSLFNSNVTIFLLNSLKTMLSNKCIMILVALYAVGQASMNSVIAAPISRDQFTPYILVVSSSDNLTTDKEEKIQAPVISSIDANNKETSIVITSKSELALLQDLRARRKELDTREAALKNREYLFVTTEQKITERIEQLNKLQSKLEMLEKLQQNRNQSNWQSLVKVYEKMRPRDAAKIFNELEDNVLIQVLDRMKENHTAAILGLMQPERARAATAHLAEWRQRTSTEAK